jgi:hypothetical protein
VTRLVGRDRDIEALDDVVRRVISGERSVVVLTGEPGIGKTRLLDALAGRFVAAGGRVAWGRTWEVGLTPAFWPWLQILGALEVSDDPAPKLGALEGRADLGSRLALFDAVAAFIERRARASAVALLVDDLHVADPSSLHLLQYLVPLLADRRVLLALAARDTDATPEASAALGQLQRGALRLPLSRLGREDVESLVGDRGDARRIFELSEGNPLFVEELLASARADGVLRLPRLSSVREVIRDRVSGLPEPTRAALVAGAVIGRDFRGRIVADMLADAALGALDDAEAGARLAPALRLGMIVMTSPDRFRFSHALIAEAMADELDPSERARLHLRAAQSLERRENGDATVIAHHLLEAGNLAAEAAVSAAERAATAAIGLLAFEDAAALLARAIAALRLAAPNDAARRARLLCAQVEALQHAGQHARAGAVCDEAAAVARTLDDPALLARIALARGLELRFGVANHVLVAALEEALGKLDPAPTALRARVLARLAAASQPAEDPALPVIHAREAIVMARSLPDRERLDVMYAATAALIDYMPPVELDPIHGEVLELARAANDRMIGIHTQLRTCFTALERLDRGGFEQSVEAYAALAGTLAMPRWLRWVHMLDALRACLDGRFADAEREAESARQISTAIGDQHAQRMLVIHRGISASVRTVALGAELREAAGLVPAARFPLLAWHAAEGGELDAARTHLTSIGKRPISDSNLAAMVAAAIVVVGDAEAAARTHDALAKRSGQIVLASMIGFCVQDLFDRMLLVLAATAGRWELIDGHAERALAAAGRLGSPVWTARVRADWADALDRRGAAGDRTRARELWTAALADAERLDMPGQVRRCRAALAGAVSRAPRSATSSEHVLVARDGELWRVSGFGEQIHVRDSRGLQMLARLLAEPGRALHALDLAGASDGVDAGDAGELLDRAARAQYRVRLSELVAERDDAESAGDRGRLEKANYELELLTAELERAVGLGGRERRTGSATERARSNVQRRLNHGVQQIRAASRRLGEHLAASIRTGTYCVYRPDSGR